MDSLDLRYNEINGFYEAPFQLKANNGVFLIDDFGRQSHAAADVAQPLDRAAGKERGLPDPAHRQEAPGALRAVPGHVHQPGPADLVDEAFLRRIQNKLHMPSPTRDQFRNIFIGQCQQMGVPFDDNGLTYLVSEHYMKSGRPMRGCHPRDLLRQLTGLARYLTVPPQLSRR